MCEFFAWQCDLKSEQIAPFALWITIKWNISSVSMRHSFLMHWNRTASSKPMVFGRRKKSERINIHSHYNSPFCCWKNGVYLSTFALSLPVCVNVIDFVCWYRMELIWLYSLYDMPIYGLKNVSPALTVANAFAFAFGNGDGNGLKLL